MDTAKGGRGRGYVIYRVGIGHIIKRSFNTNRNTITSTDNHQNETILSPQSQVKQLTSYTNTRDDLSTTFRRAMLNGEKI